MGLFWDLIQQSQISNQHASTQSLQERVDALQEQLQDVQRVQLRPLETLEQHFGRDIDGDGRVGG